MHIRKCIAVVDPDIESRVAMKEQLEKAGYQILSIDSSVRAMEIFQALELDGVIVDLCMPGMSGVELVRRFRKEHQGIPVVMLASDGRPPLRKKALNIQAVMKKPVDLQKLATTALQWFGSPIRMVD
jgi:CheY-like chemotaxis protein